MRSFVITSLQSFDIKIGSNAKNIALELAKSNKVLFVNPPSNVPFNIMPINENLYVLDTGVTLTPLGRIPSSLVFDIINKSNAVRYAKAIKRAYAMLDYRDVIHINDNDIYRGFYLKDYLLPWIEIYYLRDYLFEVPYWKTHGPRLESKLIEKSDFVFSNSKHLKDRATKYNKKSYYIGQGVDLDLYDPNKTFTLPKQMEGVDMRRKIIGYTGVLSSLRLDANLIYHIAKARPEWQIVLVGPEDYFFSCHVLHDLPNVIFTGRVEPENLAQYITYFDLCFNPQLVNDTTIGNYPRKIDEYLAMGKAIVATRTPTMEAFEPEVKLAVSFDQYLEHIEYEIANDTPTKHAERVALARSHTWANCVDTMLKIIDTHCATKINDTQR